MLNKIKDKNFFFANNWNETIQEIKNNILVLLKTKDKKIDIELSDAINLRVVIEQKDMKFHFCEDLSNNKKREYEDTIIDFNNKHIDSFIETFLSKIVTKYLKEKLFRKQYKYIDINTYFYYDIYSAQIFKSNANLIIGHKNMLDGLLDFKNNVIKCEQPILIDCSERAMLLNIEIDFLSISQYQKNNFQELINIFDTNFVVKNSNKNFLNFCLYIFNVKLNQINEIIESFNILINAFKKKNINLKIEISFPREAAGKIILDKLLTPNITINKDNRVYENKQQHYPLCWNDKVVKQNFINQVKNENILHDSYLSFIWIFLDNQVLKEHALEDFMQEQLSYQDSKVNNIDDLYMTFCKGGYDFRYVKQYILENKIDFSFNEQEKIAIKDQKILIPNFKNDFVINFINTQINNEKIITNILIIIKNILKYLLNASYQFKTEKDLAKIPKIDWLNFKD